jgi:hypothetical protein
MGQSNTPPRVQDFPLLLSTYKWDFHHAAFGWPPDCLDTGFPWIVALERQFEAALEHNAIPPLSLVTEMILWAGNQQNVLGKFSRSLREDDYGSLIREVITKLDNPRLALESALAIKGFGLTYASKLLRFCRPSMYGALDSRIRKALGSGLRRIYDGNPHSMCMGYEEYLGRIHEYQRELTEFGVVRPGYGSRGASVHWRAAEVEMALFGWASSQS